MVARALNWAIVLLGVAGSLATLIVAFQQWYPQATPDGKVAIIALSTFVAVLSVAVIWQEYRYSRKARYAETLPYLNQIILDTASCNVEGMQNLQDVENICRLLVNR